MFACMAANLFPLLVQQRCLHNKLVLKCVQVRGSARHAVGHVPPPCRHVCAVHTQTPYCHKLTLLVGVGVC